MGGTEYGTFWVFLSRAWEWLITLILPQNINGTCINASSINNDTPSAGEFLADLEPTQIVLLSVGSALTLIVFLLALTQWFYIFNYVSSEQRRNKLYLLISLFPVCTFCCLVGMFCPRTALLVSSFGLLYFLLCLFVLVSLMRHLSGGRVALAQSLTDKCKKIDFRSPPFCCILFCLPKAHPTERNLTRLEWIVLQAPIIRVLIVFGQVVVVAEAREDSYKWLQFFDLATAASLLLAIFGVHTLARVTSEELSRFGFGGIFRLVDFGLLFFTAQQPFLFQNILLRFGVIHCAARLSPQDNARFICNFCIIGELLLLSIFSIFWASPHRSCLFDQFIRRRPAISCSKPRCSRSSSLQSVRESKFEDPPDAESAIGIVAAAAASANGSGCSSTVGSTVITTSTQTSVLLHLD